MTILCIEHVFFTMLYGLLHNTWSCFSVYAAVLLKEAPESGPFILPNLTHTENLNHLHQSS